MRGLKVVVAALGVGWLTFGTAGAAAADCSGPTIEHSSGTFDRGDPISVRGTSFGTNCYDTGPPPPGEGILGTPVRGIEIALVQDDVDIVVAEGNANLKYEFIVEAALPVALQPGDVTVVARWRNGGEAFNSTSDPLIVSDAAAQPSDVEIVGFGSNATPESEEAEEATDGTSTWPLAAAVALATIAAITSAAWWVRRSRAEALG